ncbi:outer membrane lipid asymmetry maintenance protein MlaD [Idiomarina sp. M1R2S28]|jgi:phospholipid/cholesterol/gamma-HCH transport system substrate-binding protein|uniref:Outer membrane lipid asymmetry maintenance protein MlaD n=1 Tax=Idiomarina rhizosphaerae TaxID=2961572 RepID=A0A9X2G2F4_9GAMM|nr:MULTISPECIES: outer membrane lipid asymmetry maintenance protein MlaD [Idiomarina]MAA61669.1 outer membrane lipid asymmetry maintenance protein MlaD [Idiomarina sp.]NWO01696.1 outer membrane lipid asymmetry maintenance protein MlaD [Idiomarinaceae bacterium]MCP1338688.1 outer membrane lipid asymmetry maintenance protein MlaD [Idiomarina rhizosphaerae]PWW37552.1 phospholipid/cholesterol/gamma-HCH transport system substrate-binding protein [Idiomarina loihiensis]TDP47541.1 phospholipid/choles|tara:strand:+ start:32576 stop:33043 length:468 start_codon:yes stop_codon:yes gene_type:complete
MESRKTQLWVGVFVVVGILALFFIALRAASGTMTTSGDSYTLYAKFDNVGSLKVRSPVKVGGVVVGRVTDISLSGDYYEPRVTMSISKDYDKFSEASTLSVLTSGLLGEQYLGLEPGFIDDSVGTLEDGDTITDTKSALVLENLIGQFLFSQGNE